MSRIIAVVNQKGGVGKTTTAVNTAAYLAAKGKKILLVDMDSQGNATTGLGIDRHDENSKDVYDVLVEEVPVAQAIKKTSIDGLDIMASNVALAGAEILLVERKNRELRLRQALEPIKDDYDYIFIDAPPSLGLLTLNALTAADSVLIPIQAEFFALDGLVQLLVTLELVKDKLNPELSIEGVLITMFDGRTNLAVEVVKEIKEKFGEKVFEVVIPRNIKLSEAPSFGQPINIYDKNSRGAKAYDALADEIIAQNKNNKRGN
ncbi:MAG: AAA family ATPase [bacterium]